MEALAITPAKVMNVYTCTFNLAEDQIVGNAALPWSYEPDSVYNGVVIHPGTLPGGNVAPLNHGKNLVHEVSTVIMLYNTVSDILRSIKFILIKAYTKFILLAVVTKPIKPKRTIFILEKVASYVFE